MSVLTRPVDLLTRTNGMIGTPYISIELALQGGGFGSPRDIGITPGVEIAQAVSQADMMDPRSGSNRLVRRFTNEFGLILNVQTKLFKAANLQLMLMSSSVRTVSAGTASVVNELVTLTSDPEDFLQLDNALIDETTFVVSPAPIVDEFVGTGQGGTFGEVTADFDLNFAPLLIGDVTAFNHTINGITTPRISDLVSGTTPTGTQIAIDVGASSTSGQITYASGEAPPVGTLIEATYEPSHTITQDVDFFTDPKGGRLRVVFSTDKLRAGQIIEVTYDFDQLDHEEIDPGTQLTLPCRVTLQHLPDAGVNWLWTVPQASIQAGGESFTFSETEWNTHTIPITLEDDGSSNPYGTIQVFNETLVEAA